MFMPGSQNEIEEKKKQKKISCDRVEGWAIECVPKHLREGLTVSVQEFVCGDPTCSPVDTGITIIYKSGGRGMTGIPMEAQEVEKEDVKNSMPDEKTLKAWFNNEEADWPPDFADGSDVPTGAPELRFVVGQPVKCRIGSDPVNGWAKGVIIQCWYREDSWPSHTFAPYKIALDDGRNIFAPADVDQVIRADGEVLVD